MPNSKPKEMVYRIKSMGIIRRYGFRDGSYVVVGLFYKNGRPVKSAEDIVFSERSAIAEQYCKACGINREDQMDRLVGMQVHVEFDEEDGYEVAHLTRPIRISNQMGEREFDHIISVTLGPVEEEEEVA